MNNKLLYVCAGDIVEVCFDYQNPPKTFNMKVEVVERRYGNNRDGSKMNPLVAGFDLDNRKNEICDLSFVTRVISRPKYGTPKRNVFREAFNDGYRVGRSDKHWVGSLLNVTVQALRELDIELDRFIHEKRLQALYEKSRMGFTGYLSWYIKVNPKKFCKWVAKNWHRILMTSKEMHDHANEQMKHEREEFEFDMQRYMWGDPNDSDHQNGQNENEEDGANFETESVHR